MLTSIRLLRIGLDGRRGNEGRGLEWGTKAFRKGMGEFREEEGGRAKVPFGARRVRWVGREDDEEA